MKNVSREFIKTLETRRDFYYTASLAFKDGRKIELDKNGLAAQGNRIVVSPESNSFPLGFAIGKRLTLQILNQSDQFSEYDFFGATVQLYLKFDLSKNTEIINLGKYTVAEPETYGSTIILTAVDDMHKADKDYVTTLTYPRAMGEALRDSCASCNLTLFPGNIENSDFIIKKKPENITHRQFIGLCAMIAGGNAITDEFGRIKIVTYNFSAFERTAVCDGGLFDSATPYGSGGHANGGSFYPWDKGDVLDAGGFIYMDDYHVFYQHQNPTVSTDDVQITGIKTIVDEQIYLTGTEGYMLTIENQLISGNEQEALNRIGRLLIGLRFRPFMTDHTCYPLADFGDPCYVIDRKDRVYQSVVTDIDFDFKGFTTIKCSADSPVRNSSKFQTNSMTQAIIKARVNAEKQISDYDRAVQMMTSIMANSLGMFTTVKSTENGGEIVYQHNKPDLADSDIIWQKSEQGFTVSTDGGKSWNAGITADGSAVVNILSAIGINAEWIDTRGLRARDNAGNITFEINEATGAVTISASSFKLSGKTIDQLLNLGIANYDNTLSQAEIFDRLTNKGEEQGLYLKDGKLYLNFSYALGGTLKLGGQDNVNGSIEILDAKGNQIGIWDNSGLNASQGTFEGLIKSSGKNGWRTELYGSKLDFYHNHEKTGVISPIAWGNDFDNKEGVMFGTNSKYLAIGFHNPSSSVDGYAAGYILNNGLDPEGLTSRNLLYGTTYINGGLTVNHKLMFPSGAGLWFFEGSDRLISLTGADIRGDLNVTGAKSRTVSTTNYGDINLNAVESPEAYFEDYGSGIISVDGTLTVFFDEIYYETIDAACDYQVFITATSEKKVDWIKKNKGYFIAHGEDGASFDWCIVCKQRDYEAVRLESTDAGTTPNDVQFDESIFYNDNQDLLILDDMLNKYEKGVELL